MAKRTRITGVQQFLKSMHSLKKDAADALAQGMHQEAEIVLEKALYYVPKDTHALAQSGRIESSVTEGRRAFFGIGGRRFDAHASVEFGGDEAPYALWVHENPDAYHAPPTRYKFLEQAYEDTKPQQLKALKGAFSGRKRKFIDGTEVG
jgi:hypothetical protein